MFVFVPTGHALSFISKAPEAIYYIIYSTAWHRAWTFPPWSYLPQQSKIYLVASTQLMNGWHKLCITNLIGGLYFV